MKPIGIVIAFIFGVTQCADAEAHKARLVRDHDEAIGLITLDSDHPYHAFIMQKVARDWREDKECEIDREVVLWLHDIVKELPIYVPAIRVHSGFRTVKTNKLVGGVSKSMHLTCQALDISIEGVSTYDLYQAAKKTQRGGLGYYPNEGYIHIDSGRIRQW